MSVSRPAPDAEDPASEVRWLDDEESRAWIGLNGILIRLPGLLDGPLQREHGLSFFEYMVLAMLSDHPGRKLRLSRLAVLTSGSLSRLSHVAKRLERQGLIRREQDPEDRRSTYAILTRMGLAKVVAAAPDHVAAVREYVFDHLDREQVRHLGDVGRAVLAGIDPDAAAQPPRAADATP